MCKLVDTDRIALNIKRVSTSKGRCAYPSCSQITNLKTVGLKTRLNVLKEFEVYIPQEVRACPTHLEQSAWSNIIDDATVDYGFSQKHIEDMVRLLRGNRKLIENQ